MSRDVELGRWGRQRVGPLGNCQVRNPFRRDLGTGVALEHVALFTADHPFVARVVEDDLHRLTGIRPPDRIGLAKQAHPADFVEPE